MITLQAKVSKESSIYTLVDLKPSYIVDETFWTYHLH